jgi:hypothetical protein
VANSCLPGIESTPRTSSTRFLFRGVFLAGLSRLGMTVAGTLVTLLFVAGHLPESWGYPPTLVAVGARRGGAVRRIADVDAAASIAPACRAVEISRCILG